eukprot:2612-Heterococcus_DN1.PRE.2
MSMYRHRPGRLHPETVNLYIHKIVQVSSEHVTTMTKDRQSSILLHTNVVERMKYGDIRHAVDFIRNPLIKDVDQVSTDSLATVLTAAASADISVKDYEMLYGNALRNEIRFNAEICEQLMARFIERRRFVAARDIAERTLSSRLGLLKSSESTPKRLSPAMKEMALDSDIAIVTLLLRGDLPVTPSKKYMKYTVIEKQLPHKIQAAYDSIAEPATATASTAVAVAFTNSCAVLYRYAVARERQLSASQWQMLMQGMLLQGSYSDVLGLQQVANTTAATADAGTTTSAIAAVTDSVSADVLHAYGVAAELLSLDAQALAPASPAAAAAPAAVAGSTDSSETAESETGAGEKAAVETIESEAVVADAAVSANKYDAVYTDSLITLVRSLGPATPDVKLLSELFNRALAAGVLVNTELITEFATVFSKHSQQQQFTTLLEQAQTGTVTVAGQQVPVVLVQSKAPLEEALAQLKGSA